MDAVSLLRGQVKQAHDVVAGTLADVSDELAAKPGQGKAHPIGALYAHMLTGEDFVINAMLKGGSPVLMGEFAGKTGISEMPPMPGGDFDGWTKRVRVDCAQTHEYANAVYKATDDYLASLSENDLDREVTFGEMKMPVGLLVTMMAVTHPSNHIGEISAIKGAEGMTGYPF